VSISDPVKRVEVADANIVRLAERIEAIECIASEKYFDEEGDEVESARGEISDEGHFDGGPWVSNGDSTGFLDGDDELTVDQMGHEWMLRRMLMTAGEWENLVIFLLTHTVNFVDSGLVETDEEMKGFDLVIRILAEEGSKKGEGRQAISDAFRQLAKPRDNFHQQQEDVDNLFFLFYIFLTHMWSRRGTTMSLLEAQEDSRGAKLI